MRTKFLVGGYLIIGILFFAGQKAEAQDVDALGSYTPYSLYGIGQLEQTTSAINAAMGGIGVGVRDRRYINIRNVASITERDTLAFMLDFGFSSQNSYLKDKNTKTAFNTVNINNFVFSFPIWKSMAGMVGIMPYSNIGYKFENKETDNELVSQYGDIAYQKYGNGSINQLFVGVAANVTKKVSVGVQGIYYFGDLVNHSDVIFNSTATLRTLETGWDYEPNGFGVEVGAQYTDKLFGKYDVVAGASYRLKGKLSGDVKRYAYTYDDALRDTVKFESATQKITIPGKLTIGFSIRKPDKWMAGFDFERQGWSDVSFRATPGVEFTPATSTSYKVGFEYIPNKYDIRYYYKRITYRAGFHYEKSYIKLNGKQINSYGVTLGVSLPVFRLNNSLNLAAEFGQRGSTKNNLVRENFFNFMVSLNLHDIWFVKPRYE